MVHAEQISGTVQDPLPIKYSQSVISNDLIYTTSNTAYSLLQVYLICLDKTVDLPADGSSVSFQSNRAFHALKNGGGPLGEAAIHWIIDTYYATYHSPDSNPEEDAFQYVLWEIGNDFDGTVGSISPTSGTSNPSTNTTFPVGAPGHPEFKGAYETMYSGLINALPNLSANYRSTTYTVNLLVNDDVTKQNMVAIDERPPLSIGAPVTGVVKNPYTTTLTASGGSGPYTWTAVSLPPGVLLDPVTGALSGTPAMGSEGAYSIIATDTSSPKNTQTTTLFIQPPVIASASQIPTLSDWGKILLGLGVVGMVVVRRRQFSL